MVKNTRSQQYYKKHIKIVFMEINNATDLKMAIERLENQNLVQKNVITEQFHNTLESLKPMNLLKSSFNKVTKTPGLVENIMNAMVGLGAGFLSKKMLIGNSTGILKRLLGNALEFGVAGLITKNSGSIKSTGLGLFNKIFHSKNTHNNLP